MLDVTGAAIGLAGHFVYGDSIVSGKKSRVAQASHVRSDRTSLMNLHRFIASFTGGRRVAPAILPLFLCQDCAARSRLLDDDVLMSC